VRCGSMAHSAGDSMAVLVNLAPDRHRGGSCACPGTTSRVVAPESLFGRRPYTNSRAWLTGDQKLHNSRRGDVPSAWVSTVMGMTLQCPGVRGDGRTGPGVSAGLTSRRCPGEHGVGGRTPFEGTVVLFRGARRGGGMGVGGTMSRNDTGLPA
jgi:hypothetical protein